jgi:hypothetical protein
MNDYHEITVLIRRYQLGWRVLRGKMITDAMLVLTPVTTATETGACAGASSMA